MDVTKALGVFNFEDLNSIDKSDLKKRYRSAMRKSHPDLYSGDAIKAAEMEQVAKDLNEAYDILTKVIDNLEAIRKLELASQKVYIKAIIPFQKLQDLYSGEVVHLRNTNEPDFELTKSGLKAHSIMFMIECSIEDINKSTVQYFTAIKPYVLSDEYSIDATLVFKDEDYDRPEIILRAYEKEIRLTLKETVTKIKLAYKYRVFLTVQIEKKRFKDKEETQVG